MSNSNIKWLFKELPVLASKDIIPKDSVDKIKEYYGETEDTNWLKIVLAIFGTLGAILIGSGIILIFARNWEEFGIPARTVLSLAPLMIAQALCGWVLLKRRDSVAWKEPTTAFLFLAVGAAISLIGQTYNIEGDMSSFLITWMLLTVPLVYIFDAVMPAVFYLSGITFWAGYMQADEGNAVFFWVLFLVLVPYLVKNLKINAFSNRTILLLWVMTINLCISIGIVLEKVMPGLWIVVYSSFFAILLLVEKLVEKEVDSIWQKPLNVIGTIGTLVISFLLTFEYFWDDIGWTSYRYGRSYDELAGIVDYILVIVLFIGALFLIYKNLRRKNLFLLMYSSSVVLSAACYVLLSFTNYTVIPLTLYNIFTLILGIGTIAYGVKAQKTGITNGGMLIISLLIILRFFDSDMSLLLRGLSFILVGAGFIVSNAVLFKRRKGVTIDEKTS